MIIIFTLKLEFLSTFYIIKYFRVWPLEKNYIHHKISRNQSFKISGGLL